MPHRIFIDGEAGTTGLRIHQLLRERPDVELLGIDAARRKDADAKAECLAAADMVILCLPDEAARATVSLVDALGTGDHIRILDASTAHRTDDGWIYGLPELTATQRRQITTARRVANPGCYPSGFLLLVRPLVEAGWIDRQQPLVLHGISGYSGGGHRMIERHQANPGTWPARPYALHLRHKHLPEMQRHALLAQPPLFTPLVADFAQGMLIQVPIFRSWLAGRPTLDDITALWRHRYQGEPFVRVLPAGAPATLDDGFLDPRATNNTNNIELTAFGSDEQFLLVARLDNLGKGAAGAAVQNLNLMLGSPETTGLVADAAA